MTSGVKLAPMLGHCPPGFRVNEVGGDLGDRPQHKAVFENVCPRQPNRRLIEYQVVIEQEIDVERPRRKPCVAALPANQAMYRFDVSENVRR